jgi:hypothetical protein
MSRVAFRFREGNPYQTCGGPCPPRSFGELSPEGRLEAAEMVGIGEGLSNQARKGARFRSGLMAMLFRGNLDAARARFAVVDQP